MLKSGRQRLVFVVGGEGDGQLSSSTPGESSSLTEGDYLFQLAKARQAFETGPDTRVWSLRVPNRCGCLPNPISLCKRGSLMHVHARSPHLADQMVGPDAPVARGPSPVRGGGARMRFECLGGRGLCGDQSRQRSRHVEQRLCGRRASRVSVPSAARGREVRSRVVQQSI